nr:hypothetical protein HK105_005942 [Polyrhizophydium stewartii]
MVNLAAAKANPKFQRMVQHIDSLVERTRGVRSEMEQMMQITRELHDQCALQERECAALEGDQAKVKEEIETLTARIQSLMTDKMQTEQRLEELRLENAKLDSYLQVRICVLRWPSECRR